LYKCCIVRGVISEEVLRIGELSKRSGVSPELLRAWERRYGLLHPTRSAGGLRLYSTADLERVRLMRLHLASGVAAAEAASLALRENTASPSSARDELAEALDSYDEPRAQALFDRQLAVMTVDALLSDVVMPYLRDLGDRWQRGEVTVAQEHFAAAVLRGRLLGLARGWGLGVGPLAVLACLPGEQHDLGLIAFGLALRARGWRIVHLGPDAPLETVEDACRRLEPGLVVLHAVTRERVEPVAAAIRDLARHHRVALGGAAAAPDGLGDDVLLLRGDVISEATRVAAVSGEGAA
jgi:DNA-binding transcriptional MerR regulator